MPLFPPVDCLGCFTQPHRSDSIRSDPAHTSESSCCAAERLDDRRGASCRTALSCCAGACCCSCSGACSPSARACAIQENRDEQSNGHRSGSTCSGSATDIRSQADHTATRKSNGSSHSRSSGSSSAQRRSSRCRRRCSPHLDHQAEVRSSRLSSRLPTQENAGSSHQGSVDSVRPTRQGRRASSSQRWSRSRRASARCICCCCSGPFGRQAENRGS